MHTETPITDELLCAWLDGELTATERARVDAALAAQPALAERLERLRLANELTRRHADAIDRQPLRPALQALLATTAPAAPPGQAGTVVPLPLRARLLHHWQQLSVAQGSLALAASLVLAVGLALVVMQRDDSAADGFALHAALLEQVASGDTLQVGSSTLSPRFSFRNTAGDWCRVYHVEEPGQGSDNIACRVNEGWTLQASLPAAQQDADAYVPATGTADGLDVLLDQLMQGAPLSLDTEARLLRQGWQAPE